MEVVYGPDNRKDVYETTNAFHVELAKSTAGMIYLGDLAKSHMIKHYNIINTKTHGEVENLCSQERFIKQPTSPICSGFLIAEDVLVTAGHCYKTFATPEIACKNFAWVFDYKMDKWNDDPTKNVPLSNIYLCKKILRSELTMSKDPNDTLDYSIIQLDRKVVNRKPLPYRLMGKVNDQTSLVVIGHPSGLPTKISDGARITGNKLKTTFSSNLDTFHGNSGSAVFDARTGVVEGILIQGRTDYVNSDPKNKNSCKVINKCDNSLQNCSEKNLEPTLDAGEVVLRMNAISVEITKALRTK